MTLLRVCQGLDFRGSNSNYETLQMSAILRDTDRLKALAADFEDVKQSIVVVRDHLSLMGAIFNRFDSDPYFNGQPIEQLHCLNMAAEHVQNTDKLDKRFMFLTKRIKAVYDICVGCDEFTQDERDQVHFYLAVRSIVFKFTKGNAPDLAQMNARVREVMGSKRFLR